MFGSQILEVGIGLILVFLLVSLILTAVREAIESLTKTRALDLELAIAELLKDREGTGLRRDLYNHPLVYSLFPGGLSATRFSEAGKVVKRASKNVPSYIPREVFSAALQDILKGEMAKARQAGPGEQAAAAQGGDSRARGSIHLIQAYEALLQVSAGDAERARKGIEQWYDASMDRASGWFKRRTQMILLVLGVTVAVALNINAITIGQYLATNEAARTQLADVAAEIQREQGAGTDRPSVPGTAVEGAAEAGGAGNDSAAVADQPAAGNAQAGAGEEAEADGNRIGAGNSVAEAVRHDRPQMRDDELARRLDARVRAVGLPIGWDQAQLDRITAQFDDNWVWAVLNLIIGYLIVGFAATLGAPFWFDLLGKFMVVRSTVKPTEKSPDEASKDGGTGGSPKPPPKDDEDGEDGEGTAAGRAGGS